jgi:membrane associated rhomboid family serine protease
VSAAIGRGGNGSTEPPWLDARDLDPAADHEPDDDALPPRDDTPAKFPMNAALAVGVLVAVHLAVVAWTRGDFPMGRKAFHAGVLLRDRFLAEPWRIPASMILHANPRHVLSNALGTAAFGIPLITEIGLARAALVYLLSGVGGGLAAVLLGSTGGGVVGSSGAVAGLFGAWAVVRLHRDSSETLLPWRARIRTLGVALLVLPSFLSPYTAEGHPVSVASHLGGLATGMAIGAGLAFRVVETVRQRRRMA